MVDWRSPRCVQSVACNPECLDKALLLSTDLEKTQDPSWQMTMADLVCTMLEKIEVLRPEIKEIRTILSKNLQDL